MTDSILKQDQMNTYSLLMPTILQAPNKLQKLSPNKISLLLSFFIVFNRLSVV